ncbi:hypothetical protein WJX75_002544 [Coccomyxa subellipsoidea]|uniref:Uncharacterized protein n=1 Tax=Coccomyxa subellipsoidea TaxID=248742 RepID=A0ABR2YXR8_9CHLO
MGNVTWLVLVHVFCLALAQEAQRLQPNRTTLLEPLKVVEDSTADLKQQLFQHIVNGTQNLFDEANETLEHLAKPKTYVFLPIGSLLAAAGCGGGANCYTGAFGRSASLTINGTAGYPSGGDGGVDGSGGGANAPATPGPSGLGGDGGHPDSNADGPGGGGPPLLTS